MELNILEQGLATNRTIFEQSVEQPIETEFTLPDYCPEIERILKCRVVPRLSSKSLSGNSLTLDGTVCITMIYTGGSGDISSYDYPVPFSKTVDIGAAGNQPAESVFVQCEIALDYSTCRAITPRRINVHGSAVMRIKVICRRNTPIIADIDDDCVQMRKTVASATIPMAFTEKQFSLEEEIEIPSGKAAAVCILRANANPIISECKIISSKAVVKGRLCISCLYKSESGCDTIKTELPFSQIIDFPGTDEDCNSNATAQLCSFDMRTKTGMSGEIRTFTAEARVNISVEAFCTRDVSIVNDAFSTKYDTSISRSDIELERYIYGTDESFLCKKTLDFPDDTFSEIVDMWCNTGGCATAVEGNSIVCSGEITVCILGRDPGGAAVFYERPAPFDYRIHLDSMPEAMRCAPQIELVESDFSLMGSGKVEVRAELKISVTVTDQTRHSALSKISVSEDNPKPESDCALVVYFADKGEQIWDIARKYNTSPNEIAAVNELDGDIVGNSRMLLIPRV